MSNNRVMCVDPGGITLGVCLFDHDEFYSTEIAKPINSKSIELKKFSNLAIYTLMETVTNYFDTYNIFDCYCEKPRNFGSAKSHAASINGTLQQMDMFRGALFYYCCTKLCRFHDVPVSAWKGQLPKNIVNDRIKGIIGSASLSMTTDGHDWDACGIGLFVQGFFK